MGALYVKPADGGLSYLLDPDGHEECKECGELVYIGKMERHFAKDHMPDEDVFLGDEIPEDCGLSFGLMRLDGLFESGYRWSGVVRPIRDGLVERFAFFRTWYMRYR